MHIPRNGNKLSGLSMVRIGLLLVVVLFSTAVFAEGLESTDRRLVGERPHPPGEATVVTLELYLHDIDRIDDAGQRFSADIFVDIGWQDPRLALPEDARPGRIRTLPLTEVWTPRGLIVNDRGLSVQLPRVADVDAAGNVHYRQRLSGELAADLNFKEFPFDAQRLPIEIISYQYSPDELSFSSDSSISGNEASFSAEGWRFRIVEPEIGVFTVSDRGIVLPRLTYVIEAHRDGSYYMLTMVLPMSLIVFMAWTALWLHPDQDRPRIGISTASVFSLIALGVSIRLRLPPVAYLTRADIFVIGSTLMVFLALGVSVAASRWVSADRMEHAQRLNAAARWIYIGLFALVCTAAMTI